MTTRNNKDHGITISLTEPLTSLAREGHRNSNGSNQNTINEQLKPLDGLSYVRGESSTPLSRQCVWQVLRDTAQQNGSRDAAVFCESGTRWSWAELLRRVDDLAAGLLALGLNKGDRLAIWSPNNEQWLLCQFATARVGIILVTINPAYRTSELEYALNKSAARVLIMAERFKTSDYVSMINEIAPELASCQKGKLRSSRLPQLRSVVRVSASGTNPDSTNNGSTNKGINNADGSWQFDEIMRLGGPANRRRLNEISATLDPDDPINIQFTSGTTGAPKGATLSHYNIVNNARHTVARLHLGNRDRLCIPVPLYHCFGMVMGTLGCATVGACMVFPGPAFDAKETLLAIGKEHCTALYAVPTMFVAMLEHESFAGASTGHLRTGIMAGAPCPRQTMQRVINEMNMREVTIAYGMTETSPVSFQSHVDDVLDQRVSTVGRVHPHTEVKIVDSNHQIVPIGEQGELCTRGYLVMRGYWKNETGTREAIDPSGWMHSGDLATIDNNGYCSIVGRVKDMLIRGGENIYPREIEEFLAGHDKIQQVQVFGVPDEKFGERVCAWIILQAGASMTESEIQDYCRGRIAHYKVPEHIRFKTELPMTVTGKPQKFVMRDSMIRELN